jgi:hypothetical protein
VAAAFLSAAALSAAALSAAFLSAACFVRCGRSAAARLLLSCGLVRSASVGGLDRAVLGDELFDQRVVAGDVGGPAEQTAGGVDVLAQLPRDLAGDEGDERGVTSDR